jgi:hypothetical protein
MPGLRFGSYKPLNPVEMSRGRLGVGVGEREMVRRAT